MWEVGFPHNKQFSGTSRIAKKPTQFWHNLLGDNTRFHRLMVLSNKTPPSNMHTLYTPDTSPGSLCS